MIRSTVSIRNLACALAFVGTFAAWSAAPALAAPSFGVTLERDAAAFPVVTHSDERVDYTVKVKNTGTDPTSGTVAMELELPGGTGTSVHLIETSNLSGWSCTSASHTQVQNARAICTNSSVLGAGAEYSPVTVTAAIGADTPDVASATASAFGGGAPAPGSDSLNLVLGARLPFAMTKFTAAAVDNEGHDYTQAGGHSFAALSEVSLTRKRPLVPAEFIFNPLVPIEQLKQVVLDAPRGFVGNALALPELCPGLRPPGESVPCPEKSAVGGININISVLPGPITLPIYALEPELGVPAQFGFQDPLGNIYTFSPHLRADDGYAISFTLAPAPEVGLLDSTVTLCNFGAISPGGGFGGCKEKGEPGANPKPLFTNPTRCGVPLMTRGHFNSWQNTSFVEAPPFLNATITGCDAVKFEPQIELHLTSRQADSPSGLEVNLSMPTQGLEDPNGVSQANVRQAKITFPEGMAINGSAGQGLDACSAAQVKLKTNLPIECPLSSKIGSVEIDTPLIEDDLKGNIYVAKQGDVEGALIGLYLVFDSPENGILIKIPVRVDPDPETGRLVATVNELPEAPFSIARMTFPGGPRATLLTPPKCGTYSIKAELTPSNGSSPVIRTSSLIVDKGSNGDPCPDGGLDATFSAGSANPLAGQTSPFNIRLTRPDGSDRFAALDLKLPPGLTAYLTGVPYCAESAIAQAKSREGAGMGATEIADPSCPAASQIGRVVAGAGAGDNPLFVDTGHVYLAGPYKGAPLSIVVIAPAVAGPLDFGNLVVRSALYLNPKTAEVSAVSDPIPHILHGVLLDVRDVRVMIDRDHFNLNPTDCSEKQVSASVGGLGGGSLGLSNRFQVGGCDKLGFEPKLYTRLFGGIHRGDYPRFRTVYAPRPGEDANVKDLVLRFPRSEFVEQGHFRTICTRAQFAAGPGFGADCPEGSIYGHVTAITPLLDEPLSGPVFLRSSDHQLPDAVFAMHGQVDAEATVRVDSTKGGLRASVEDAPDVPLTKVIVNMLGRQKGLFVNSRNICAHDYRTSLRASAHNGLIATRHPLLSNGRCRQPERKDRARRG